MPPNSNNTGNSFTVSGRRRGSAIVIVLMLIFLLTISVLSFFLLVEDDRQRAHSFLDVIRAQIMIESASQEVIAKIMDGSEVPYTNSSYGGSYSYAAQANMTASPGLMEVRYYNQAPNRGYQTGANAFTDTNSFFRNPFNSQYESTGAGDWQQANPQLIPLFSWKWYAPGIRYLRISGGAVDTSATNADYNPATQFNINTSENPFYPGELYLSGLPTPTVATKTAYDAAGNPATSGAYSQFQFRTGESSLDRPIYVQWVPIYEDPSSPPGPKNKVIGRYAYWVDVENTKVNLNTSTRLFDESPARAVEGNSEAAMNTGSRRYNVLGATQNLGSSSFGTSTNSATYNRDFIEAKLWRLGSGTNAEVEMDGSTNQGNNSAAAAYFNLWFGWNSSPINAQWNVPLAADSSMVDWRVFTGMRPYGPTGQGTNVSVEALASSYGTNIPNAGAFNTWLESYSLLDPQVQLGNSTIGQLTLATMRRTHSMSTTIYGYEDELDPLGRPKLDIVAFQKQPLGGQVYQELWNRLNDKDYHAAYYPNAFTANGNKQSFIQSYNGFAGDLSPANTGNGQAVVNQMLVNIYNYAQPHNSPPVMSGLTGNTSGVWPVKSMPYVAEVATRARSAMILLAPSNRVVGNFFTNVVTTNAGVPSTNWYAVNQTLTGTDNVGRPNFWYLTNMLVDLGFGFVNPNPFANNTNVSTLTIQAENAGSFWDSSVTPDPLYNNGATFGSASDTLHGTYALRPSPNGEQSGVLGLRANGTNCYFNLGAVPSSTLTNPANAQALQIKGWKLTDAGGNVFHQVPMPNLGQSSPARSWWKMAAAGVNAGPINHMTSLAWFQAGGLTPKVFTVTTTNAGVTNTVTYTNNVPSFSANTYRAVGWFTTKTICEFTNVSTNISTNAAFAGFIYPQADTNYGTTLATMTNIPDSVYQAKWGSALSSHMANCSSVSMVERVQCVDPPIGHRTGNPDNTITANASQLTNTYYEPAVKYQIQGVTGGGQLKGHFYGIAGHPWRLYDNYASSTVVTTASYSSGGSSVTNTNYISVQVPVGNTFTIKQIPVITVTETGGGGGGGSVTSTNVLTPLSCLTKLFDNPNVTRTNQTEWDGSYIAQYGGIASQIAGVGDVSSGYNLGQNSEASVIWTTNKGVKWPADLEGNALDYVGGDGLTSVFWFDGRPGANSSAATGLRGKSAAGNNTTVAATFHTPWGIVDSAPSGQPMTSIGELGFVHSGFLQHPINLSGVQYLKLINFGGAPTTVLGSPQNGPPMSMLLDLFNPHAFRDNVTGIPHTDLNSWANSTTQNTPSNPRRGTFNVNEGIASDYYLAVREGYPKGATGSVRADPTAMAVRPAWVPTAMFFRLTGGSAEESNFNNANCNGGKLDPFMQPVPRYRRGWDSVISMIGGDFSPFRGMGEGAWLGRGGTATDGGVGYAAIGLPLATWAPGLGSTGGGLPFANFDPAYGASAELLTLGREAPQSSGASTPRGYFTGLFAADQVSYDYSGTNNVTTLLAPNVNNEAKGNLWQSTRFAITPLRHFLSEIPYDVTGQRDIYLPGARMTITPDVGNVHTALNMGPSYSGPFSGNGNGSAGIMHQMGIYQNSFIEQAANMASTSANAFTIHIVAQAIKNNGKVRYNSSGAKDVGNSGPGYMNVDDQVLAEQWAQIVVERIPRTTAGGDLNRGSSGAPVNDYKILYYRILDNAK